MTFSLIQPIFADGFGGVITVVFLLISFIGWIVNLVNESNKKKQEEEPQRRRRKNRQRNDDAQDRSGKDNFQNEIDQFLNEVQGNGTSRQSQEPAIEIVSEREIQQRRQKKRQEQKRRKNKQRQQQQQQRKLADQQVGALEQRHLGTSHLGDGVTAHVSEYMHESRDLDDRDPLRHEDNSPYQYEESSSRSGGSLLANDVAKMLRTPRDVQKAILLNEILSPCRGLSPLASSSRHRTK